MVTDASRALLLAAPWCAGTGGWRAAVGASAAATAGTAPLVWLHFGWVTPVAVLANGVGGPKCELCTAERVASD